MDNRLWKGEGIYINELKPPPIYRKRLEHHLIRDAFISVKRSHLVSHNKIGLWLILRKTLIPEGNQILNCMWVYMYKFNKAGWFTKCKARFVIKGNQ